MLIIVFHSPFWFEGILESATMAEFPVSLSYHVGLMPKLLHTHQKVSFNWELVALKMIDVSNWTETSIYILTSAAHFSQFHCWKIS